jgi:hypothetical protein
VPRSRGRNRPRRPVPAASRSLRADASVRDLHNSLARRSAGALLGLSRLPRWLLLIMVLAVTLIGLFVTGPGGAAALVLLTALLAWLLALSWPRLPRSARIGRLVILLAVLAVAGWQGTR